MGERPDTVEQEPATPAGPGRPGWLTDLTLLAARVTTLAVNRVLDPPGTHPGWRDLADHLERLLPAGVTLPVQGRTVHLHHRFTGQHRYTGSLPTRSGHQLGVGIGLSGQGPFLGDQR